MLLAIIGSDGDEEALLGAGFLGLGYALAYAITGYVKSKDRTD